MTTRSQRPSSRAGRRRRTRMAADGCGDAEAAYPMEPRRRDRVAPARGRAGLAARLFAALSLIGLCGCASTADFGRLNDVLVTDDVHAWVGEEAATRAGRPISANNLTEAERTLRDLAFPLIEPPYDRLRWDAVVLEYGTRRKFVDKLWLPDTSAYYLHLQNALLRTSAARYNTLIDDIRNDIDRISPFYQTARAVVELDRRRQSTLDLVQTLTPAERVNAEARIGENSLVIAWVKCRCSSAAPNIASRSNTSRSPNRKCLRATPTACCCNCSSSSPRPRSSSQARKSPAGSSRRSRSRSRRLHRPARRKPPFRDRAFSAEIALTRESRSPRFDSVKAGTALAPVRTAAGSRRSRRRAPALPSPSNRARARRRAARSVPLCRGIR